MVLPPIAQNALIVGLCPLVPLPILDELFRRRILGDAFAGLGRQAGLALERDVLDLLARRNLNLLLGCLLAVFWWPIRKLLKTFFFFLTIKDCLDWASEAIALTAMVQEALRRGLLPHDAARVRAAMDEAARAHIKSPVLQMLRKAKPTQLGGWPDPGAGALVDSLGILAARGGGGAALAAFCAALDAPVSAG